MRFTEYLKDHINPKFKETYIDYEGLSQLITASFTDNDEQIFISSLEKELDKVSDFITYKLSEYTKNARELEKQAETDKKNVKSETEKLQHEIKEFSEFLRINTVGFNKILKKHDSKTSFMLRPMFRYKLKAKLRDISSVDDLLYRVSKIFLKTTDISGDNDMSAHRFIRKTDKYWVHKENLVALKCTILNNLPIYVHTEKKEAADLSTIQTGNSIEDVVEVESPYHNWNTKKHDTCVSSVYLDNEKFELYDGRLRKLQGAEAIRIRWYGKKIPEILFVERKRHEEDWTGMDSTKLRFKIYEKNINDYILGKNVWKEIEGLNVENKDDAYVLYNEIQNAIKDRNLRPSIRTFYKRTAFQLPNSSRVRISLDTHLCMIRECLNFNIPFTNWRREDVECEYPFYKLHDVDIVRFPYAILEIKLQSTDGTQPEWIDKLFKSNLVEHIHKFSKYIHGCSVLFPQIQDIPYWLPQMNTEIRREYSNGNLSINLANTGCLESAVVTDEIDVNIDGRRVAIPVRVEPKVYFANERTFLSWLHFSIFLGGIGTALLGLGDRRAAYSGIIFILTSALFAGYALYSYIWRAGMIRLRDPGPYDDLYGPVVLVFVFLLAMSAATFFKFPFK